MRPHHARRLDVAAQSHAAGGVALAHAGSLQRLGDRAGGEHDPGGAQLDDFIAPLEPARRRRGPPLPAGPRSACSKCAPASMAARASNSSSSRRAARPGCRARRSGRREARCSHMRDGLGARHHGVQQAQARASAWGVGDEAVSAGFVAAWRVLVHQPHAAPGLRQHAGAGGTCGPAPMTRTSGWRGWMRCHAGASTAGRARFSPARPSQKEGASGMRPLEGLPREAGRSGTVRTCSAPRPLKARPMAPT